MKSEIYKFFNYDYFKIFTKNIKNNNSSKYNKKVFNLIFKREIAVIIFIILRFLSLYVGLKDYYSNVDNSFFIFLKNNILDCFLWIIFFSILPAITTILNNKKIKSKFYLIITSLYFISNLFCFIGLAYFVSIFMISFLIGIPGILSTLSILWLNINIINEIIETNLELPNNTNNKKNIFNKKVK